MNAAIASILIGWPDDNCGRHSDIHCFATNVAEVSMTVPVKHPRSTVHLRPRSKRIMAHDDALLVQSSEINLEFVIVNNLVPSRILDNFVAIMITDDEPLLAV